MKWQPFHHSGVTYDLSHLHPFDLEVVQPASGADPERTYSLFVRFSLHCFSQASKPGDDLSLAYSDNRETRTFCHIRYQLSHALPEIVRSIHTKRCNHTGQGNFFLIEVLTDTGQQVEYEIYFDVNKLKAGKLEIFIQSAYVREQNSVAYRPRSKKISFFVILYNRLHGKPIKTPR